MTIIVLGKIQADELQQPRIDNLSAQCDGSASGFFTDRPFQSGILVQWNGMTLHRGLDYLEDTYIENATSGFYFLEGQLPIFGDNLQAYYYEDLV